MRTDEYRFSDPITRRPWRIVLTDEGDRSRVEFWDMENAGKRGIDPERGQFVADYFLRTLKDGGWPVGLSLHFGVEAWTVSMEGMAEIEAWIDGEVRPEEPSASAAPEAPQEEAREAGWFGFDWGPVFPGFDTGRSWNGWACPLFTRAEAERVLAWMWAEAIPGEPRSHIDADGVLHLFAYGADYGADEPEGWTHHEPTHDGLYSIGGGSLCWDRYTEDEAAERNAEENCPGGEHGLTWNDDGSELRCDWCGFSRPSTPEEASEFRRAWEAAEA